MIEHLPDGFFNFVPSQPLSSGEYNKVRVTMLPVNINGFEAYWVIKSPKPMDVPREYRPNLPERAVRKLKLYYPNMPVYLYGDEEWAMPYFGDTPAADGQIEEELLEIRREVKHVVIDACQIGNFIAYTDKFGQKHTVLVDPDLMCQKDDESRPASPVSKNIFAGTLQGQASSCWFFNDSRPNTVRLTYVLFLLDCSLKSHEIKPEFLHLDVLKQLYSRYRPFTQIRQIELSDLQACCQSAELPPETEIKQKPKHFRDLSLVDIYSVEKISKLSFFNSPRKSRETQSSVTTPTSLGQPSTGCCSML